LTCCCWGVVGLVLGIVALVLAKKDLALYQANPELYSNYSNINTGRILAIIGIVLSSIYLIWTIYSLVVIGPEGMMEMQERLLERFQAEQANQ
jgi:hypothetical protein